METYVRKIISPEVSDPDKLAMFYRDREYSRPPSISSGSYEFAEEEEELSEESSIEEESAPDLTLWEEVTKDFEEKRLKYIESRATKEKPKSEKVRLVPESVSERASPGPAGVAERASNAPASVYLAREILPELIPALEDTLKKAEQANCLDVQRCRYNGIDNIAEYLWNKHSNEDPSKWLDVFEIPPFKEWLREHPRPIFPLSWLWTPEEAALIIQRNVRGYFVRRHDDVQEMRKFWKAFRAQKKVLEERRKTVLLERVLSEKRGVASVDDDEKESPLATSVSQQEVVWDPEAKTSF